MATLLDLAPRPWGETVATLLDEIDEQRLWGLEFVSGSTEPAIWLTARRGALAQHERVVRIEAWPLDQLKNHPTAAEELGDRGIRMLQRASLLAIYAHPFLLHQINARGLMPKDGPVIGARSPSGPLPIESTYAKPYAEENWNLPDFVFSLIRQH